MVSTRQMSITTVGPEAGSSNVCVSNTSGRAGSSTALSQQSGLTTRQQSNSNSTNISNSNNSSNLAATATSSGESTSSNSGITNKDALITTAAVAAAAAHNQTQLTDMPLEIFEKIFTYTGYREVSNMRLVSTQMNQICKTVLNSTFSKLQTQLMKRFQNIKKIMPRRESARRSHPLSFECDIIDTCCMRLSLLQMTFGRHIEHKRICFFPGAFLDEVYNVLNYVRCPPSPQFGRPYKITEELIDLSTMAIEYFKDHLEPTMPQFNCFYYGKTSTTNRTTGKDKFLFDVASASTSSSVSTASNKFGQSSQSSSMPSPPQSNMVLRKGIREIKQGMKKYNNQLSVLRTDLRFCKRKSTDQTKQITELQNMLAEQQKQTLEYANRLDENDKKSEEMSSKISTLLQELNKCKSELLYWRSRSPATPICNSCGQTTVQPTTGALLALLQHTMDSRESMLNVSGGSSDFDLETKLHNHETSTVDLKHQTDNGSRSMANETLTTAINSSDSLVAALSDAPAKLTSVQFNQALFGAIADMATIQDNALMGSKSVITTDGIADKKRSILITNGTSVESHPSTSAIIAAGASPIVTTQSQLASHNDLQSKKQQLASNSSVILSVGQPPSRFYGKRKADDTFGSTSINIGATHSNTSGVDSLINTEYPIDVSSALATTNFNGKANSSSSTAIQNLANSANNSNPSDNYNKKARRVQNKIKFQSSNMNIKTRNK